jgi:hypothetical protein
MSSTPSNDAEVDLRDRSRREHLRSLARQPHAIGKVLAQVITTRGYGRVEGNRQLQAAWQNAVGDELAAVSRACRVQRGRLEVLVSNSVARQLLEFQRAQILAKLRSEQPDLRVHEVRFRVGRL